MTLLAGDPGMSWDVSKGLGQNQDGAGPNATFGNGNVYDVGLAVDSAGYVYVADSNCTIRKVTPDGVVSTIAGNWAVAEERYLYGGLALGNLDAPGLNAQFFFPSGLAVDSLDNLYVADSGNAEVRKITPQGSGDHPGRIADV